MSKKTQSQTERIAITNEIVYEMSGVKELRFNCPNSQEMTDAERILSRIKTFNFLLSYVASGSYMDVHLQQYGLKHNYLNAKWWKQFKYISESVVVQYTKTSRYFVAASHFLSQPNDEELVKAGDPAALERVTLIGCCSRLLSAINASADHPFFKSTFDHLTERVRRKQLPIYTQSPELVQEEWDIVKKVCEGVKAIRDKEPSLDADAIIAKYVYAEFDHPVEEETEPPTSFAALGNRIFDISDRQYQFALSVRPESDASVLPVPADIMERLKFDEKTGQLSVTDETNEALSTLSGRLESWTSKEKVTASDFMFLRTALTALYKNPEFINADRVTIKRSELGKHMGADLSAGNAVDVLARLKPLEKLIGRTPDGSIYRVFTFLKYDSATDSYSFACPFINQVILRLEDKNQVEYKTKTKGIAAYKAPHINFLLHSTLHKERNKRAVEIVMALTNLFLQRAGETTRKPTGRDRFDVHIKYRTLISYCPLLAASLEDCPDMAHKNRILKSAFSKAAILLKEQTDAYTYFENLRVSDMIVTNKTIDEVISASFSGIHHAD